MTTFNVELTLAEVKALRAMEALMLGSLEENGADLTQCELPDGTIGPSPLFTGAMKLELTLVCEGEEV